MSDDTGDMRQDEVAAADGRHRLPRRGKGRRRAVNLRSALQPLVGHADILGLTELDPAALEIGLLIKRARLSKGLTQAAVAKKAGVTQSALSDIENGKGVDGPSYRVIRQIAEAVDMELTMSPRQTAPAFSREGRTWDLEPADDSADDAIASTDVLGDAARIFCMHLERDERHGLSEFARRLRQGHLPAQAPASGARGKIVSVAEHARAHLHGGWPTVLVTLSGKGEFAGATPVPGADRAHVYFLAEGQSVTIEPTSAAALSFMVMPAEPVFRCLAEDTAMAEETESSA